MKLQEEYDRIYSFFKRTSEPFYELDWNGEILEVVLNDAVIETYSFEDLKEYGFLNQILI